MYLTFLHKFEFTKSFLLLETINLYVCFFEKYIAEKQTFTFFQHSFPCRFIFNIDSGLLTGLTDIEKNMLYNSTDA